ncbi:MAG TPA: prolipoprotein diacylglyceryl transferase [Herpetosiphonaceae bacterium]
MYPPDDQFLIKELFGLFSVRWYAVCILGGAILAAWFGARRVAARGHDPEHAWNLLALGLITSIICARAWYVAFEWGMFEARRDQYSSVWRWLVFDVMNPATGGIAIQGAIVGAVIGAFIYTRWNGLDFLRWIDFGAPCMAIGQAIGRWGNFFNQEAYGRPMATPQPWGLRIDEGFRVEAFPASEYPVETTRFHPAFLYESLWNVFVLIALLAIERRFERWLRKGDLFLLYGIIYSIGRFFVEGLRTDSLCLSGVGGSCEGSLRAAQVTALVTIAIFGAILAARHLRQPTTPKTPPPALAD